MCAVFPRGAKLLVIDKDVTSRGHLCSELDRVIVTHDEDRLLIVVADEAVLSRTTDALGQQLGVQT